MIFQKVTMLDCAGEKKIEKSEFHYKYLNIQYTLCNDVTTCHASNTV